MAFTSLKRRCAKTKQDKKKDKKSMKIYETQSLKERFCCKRYCVK